MSSGLCWVSLQLSLLSCSSTTNLTHNKINEHVLHLVLGFEHQQVGDVAEGQTQADHLSLSNVVGKFADVENPRRPPRTSYVTFELLAVVAIGYRGDKLCLDDASRQEEEGTLTSVCR